MIVSRDKQMSLIIRDKKYYLIQVQSYSEPCKIFIIITWQDRHEAWWYNSFYLGHVSLAFFSFEDTFEKFDYILPLSSLFIAIWASWLVCGSECRDFTIVFHLILRISWVFRTSTVILIDEFVTGDNLLVLRVAIASCAYNLLLLLVREQLLPIEWTVFLPVARIEVDASALETLVRVLFDR